MNQHPRKGDMTVESVKYCMILTACGSFEEAERIARLLVEERAAACVQMTGITSVYTWKGKTEKEAEVLLLIKTRSSLYGKVEALISAAHSYEIPEIVALPLTEGLERYFTWVDEVTQQAT